MLSALAMADCRREPSGHVELPNMDSAAFASASCSLLPLQYALKSAICQNIMWGPISFSTAVAKPSKSYSRKASQTCGNNLCATQFHIAEIVVNTALTHGSSHDSRTQ